jgi:Zn-dependent protease
VAHSQFAERIILYSLLFGSIILHEVSHGWSALALGDDTAKRAGRLSLNPLVHVDVVGTIVLPAILVLTNAGFIFGWAKPVPVSVNRLRHPRNDAVYTGLAGPAMNLLLVGVAYVALHVTQPLTFWPQFVLFYFGLLNLNLAAFNLLPIPPLDGSSVVERFLPEKWWGPYLAIRPYTLLIVMGVVFIGSRSGATNAFFDGLANWWSSVSLSYLN